MQPSELTDGYFVDISRARSALHALGDHPLLPAVGRVKAPHHIEVHVLIPRTCDYAALHSQGDFANVI